MRTKLVLAALAVVVVANAVVLAGVAWNRSGPADAALVLTERELPYHHYRRSGGENTGITLGLRYAHRDPAWFDAAKLRAAGFDLDGYDPDTEWQRRKQPLPRRAYVVLEYDGPAWAAQVRVQEEKVAAFPGRIAAGEATLQAGEQAQRELERMRTAESRLVPLDAGSDAAALRERYPDRGRYLITPAEVRIDAYARGPDKSPQPRGYIVRILTSPVVVPADLRPAFEQATAQPRGDGAPRYQATITYGRRHEPWISDIRPLTGE